MKKQITVKELVELHGHTWQEVESTIREVPYTQNIWNNSENNFNLVTFDCLLAIAKLIDVDFELVLKAQAYEYKKSKKL